MKITEHEYCRFWGYETLSSYKFITAQGAGRRAAEREKRKADYLRLKAMGLKSGLNGFRSKEAACLAAKDIEEKTGVEMHVFNHDYL